MSKFMCTCGTVIEGDDTGSIIAAHERECDIVRLKWWEIILNGVFSPIGLIVLVSIAGIIAGVIGA